jgi:glyoxylase-like metal-dependent hydrolase (beta-lactamase superfamily II)
MLKTALATTALLLAASGVAAFLYAPYLEAEAFATLNPHSIIDPSPATLAAGRMFDDYWAIQQIDDATYAIGEPRYYQQNYSYLILGHDRALLFDAGSGTRNIAPVVASLTRLPVTLLVSHLHFDHLAGVKAVSDIALVDLPETRADNHDGMFSPTRYEFLGLEDGLETPRFRVSHWLVPDSVIDLGGRRLTLLSTPGHTPSSVALLDRDRNQLFAGDFMYPTELYAFFPGADVGAYLATATRLLTIVPQTATIWTAHCCRVGEGIGAPWLTFADLRDLQTALVAIHNGSASSTGFYPRHYKVNTQMGFAGGFFR